MNSAVNDDPGVSRTGRPGDRPGDETARRDDTVRHEPVRDGTGRTESGRNETTNEMTQDTVLRETAPDRRDVVQRQREAYGGIKVGSCFFGWLTATGTALLLTALIAAAGAGLSLLLARLNGFPRIPMNEGDLTTGGILAAAGVAVVSLLGAMLGGLTGMRFHRRVDRVGYDPA